MSLVALVALLSLDVTTTLVSGGYGLAALSIVGATNATPIVVTTSAAHNVAVKAHVVISGVLGNTAANNLDTDGVTNNAWHAVPVDATRLALYSVSRTTGAITPSVGSGAYTSGGTLRAALTDGRILLGREHVYEQSAPPRIVMIPVGGMWGPKSVANPSNVNGYPSAEVLRQNQQRSIRTENVNFECHVWGAASTPDPENDFDATQVLYHQLVRSAHTRCAGVFDLSNGQWADQGAQATQITKSGHEFVFAMSLATPVLGKLLPLAPADVAPEQTSTLVPGQGGAGSTGCQGN